MTKYPTRHIHATTAIKTWIKFESAIGIDHAPGRSFYGLRRGLTDTAKDFSANPRALNNLTGHSEPGTRESHYVDQEREEDQAEAAVIRRRMRLSLARKKQSEDDDSRASGPNGGFDGVNVVPDISLAEALDRLDPTARETVLSALRKAPTTALGADPNRIRAPELLRKVDHNLNQTFHRPLSAR